MKLKKVLAALLVITMMMSIASISVLADTETVIYVSTAEELRAAEPIAAGTTVIMEQDISIQPIIHEGYDSNSNTQGVIIIGGTLDGNGHTLSLTDEIGDTKTIVTTGGTIKNLTISNGFRGISIWKPTSDIILDSVNIDPGCYGINTAEHGSSTVNLIATNSSFKGWNSYAGNLNVTFTKCSFEQGLQFCGNSVYGRLIKPYVSTLFDECTFADPYYMDLSALGSGEVVSLMKCYVGETPVTSANRFEIFEEVENGTTENFQASTADFINNAKGVDYTVTLNKLNENAAIDLDADATYKVVLDEAPEADIQAVETKLAEAVQADAGKTYEKTDTFDIKVIKIENDTEEEVQNVIVDQNVTIDLENAADIDKPLAVYHVVNGSAELVTGAAFANEGQQVTFTAPSFSTYSVSYTPVAVKEENITDSIGIAFNKVSDDVYDITVKAMDDNKKIYRLMSTDLTFGLTPITGALSLSYEISPATYVNLIEKENGRYEFNFNGTGASYATGSEIKIGEVKFIGYGKAKFETTDAATNVVNTAKLVTDGTTTTDDNIVKHYTANGNIAAGEKLLVGNAVLDGSGVINPVEIKAATKNLTINVKFNNIISDNKAAYQDMKVTVSGGDLTSPIVKNFGSEGGIALNGDTYTVEIADTLTKNVGYTVKVEGAGYRTARHIVTMTENKVLNFWNNVKDSANATAIETGKTPMTKNFLAGDIVKDNNINIYDLSAVVSYFGTENLVSAHSAYAKYDLNRDGVIDSKDVAYVLVSWGE